MPSRFAIGHARSTLPARLLLLLLFALASPVRGAAPRPESEPTGNGRKLERVVLQLRHTHQFQFAGLYAAIEKGYYREAGLEVVLREGSPDIDAIDEVLAGRADYGINGAQLVMKYAQGSPVVALAVIFQHAPAVLIVLEKSGIRTPQELPGKKIMMKNGVPSASLLMMLAAEGVPLDSFQRVPLSYTLDDLIDGRADATGAYLSNEPYELIKRGIPFQVFNPLDYGIDFYGDCLFTSRHEAEAHRARAAAMRAASLKGWDYAMAHVEETIDLILRRYAPGSDPDRLAFEAAAIRRLMLPGEIEIGHMNPGRWAMIAQRLHDVGLMDKAPDEKTIAAEFLFDPLFLQRNGRWLRQLAWFGGLLLAGVLVLSLMLLSLSRLVQRRTAELSAANRMQVRENEERRKAQELLRLQRDLVFTMGDMTTVREALNVLLATVTRVPGVDCGGVYLQDGRGGFDLVAQTGISAAFVEKVRHVEADSVYCKILITGLTHLRTESDLKDNDANAFIDAEGLRSTLVVPVKFDGRVIGALNMASRSLSAFPENTVTAIEAAAMQIGGIIARLQAVEALRESEQKFRNLADSAPSAIVVAGEDGRFVYLNPHAVEMTGYAMEELVGASFQTILPSSEMERVVSRFKTRLTGGSVPVRYDTFFRRKDGQPVPIDLSVCRIRWGGAPAVLGHCVDLTERRRLENEIVKISQWEKNRIGHDLHDSLGQQLAGIAYLCQALEGNLAAQSNPLAGKAAQISSALREAMEQVRRIVRGLSPVDMEEGGLEAALKRLAEEAQSSLGVACRFHNGLSAPVRAPQTASHLYHIAQEALTNAVRHGGARHVEIRLTGDGRQGELTVADDGCGLSARRVGEAGEGNGSGLKIMRYRIERVGGALSLNDTEDGGLTVQCTYNERGCADAAVEGGRDEGA